MKIVLLTAIGVGSSTIIGAVIGFFIKKISHKTNDIILSFASGIMLGAAFFSLIIPALSQGENSLILSCVGILSGAFVINFIDFFIPHNHNYEKNDSVDKKIDKRKVILFLIAIAIHNFPEGMAVGVAFAGNNIKNAVSLAIAISLQNIPEGIITIIPLILSGTSKKKALLISFFTGFIEVIGVILGYFVVNATMSLLPFILSFAGGTMIFVISKDMIPETHSHGFEKTATFSLLIGIIVMMIIDNF